ncbi:hypothetical protein R5R35_011672 [Gryllus longicercus]|uniref:Uncharacterized protein n=1 Tax=Gryllus longicercus TaxID=2509291 RepID=A0AAN9YYI0_9ORTH
MCEVTLITIGLVSLVCINELLNTTTHLS